MAWDAARARRKAKKSFGAHDASEALRNADRAFESQGWRLSSRRLWWEPGWSPESFLRLAILARWGGAGEPRRPRLSATVYDLHGDLVTVEDISPDDEDWHGGRTLRYETRIHLVRSGPKTAPSAVFLSGGEADEAEQELAVLNPGLEDFSVADPHESRWVVNLTFAIATAKGADDAAAAFRERLRSPQTIDQLVLRVDDTQKGRIYYATPKEIFRSGTYFDHLLELQGRE